MPLSGSTNPPRSCRSVLLQGLYDRYHHRRFVTRDPLIVLYDYPGSAEREIVGLLAACLAYGNVTAILGGIAGVIGRLDGQPLDVVTSATEADLRRRFRGFRYRVTSGPQIAALLIGVQRVIAEHGSLHEAFAWHVAESDVTVMPGLGRFVDNLTAAAGSPLMHLLPHPQRGSACKRLNLYLRWMVRCDAIDPGGWSRIDPAKLVVPLDTHMHRMARRLRLTRRKTATLATALDITASLRRICPTDPIRYDFALTRPGILGDLKTLNRREPRSNRE